MGGTRRKQGKKLTGTSNYEKAGHLFLITKKIITFT